MDVGFVDLDILLTRIRNEKSRSYFLDAVKAYKAGALRAALTSAWVALVYDLIAKYRELSAMGDKAATSFISAWDNATNNNDISKLLQLEGSIIEDATANTQVLNSISQSHLKRVHDDRHLCAHPAFSAEAELFEPSPELVRLHLVNVVDLVLAREPLQGTAILELFDSDVQSPGFPIEHGRILDYVEQRYLDRVRPQNIRNFGTVLAKSLIRGVPAPWDAHQSKITASLVALRERAPSAWGDISQAIVRLLDSAEPEHRSRMVAFIASFPDFWDRLQNPTKIALQETVTNIDATTLKDFRILAGLRVPQFRDALLSVIRRFGREKLAEVVAKQPVPELWEQALLHYKNATSYRDSEKTFDDLIIPFAGVIDADQFDLLIDAIINNGQNWNASGTPGNLRFMLLFSAKKDWPTLEARNSYYQFIRAHRRISVYKDVTLLFLDDGWTPPPAPEVEDDD